MHQFQGLAVILVSLEDDIGQLVDDDVQGSLLLNRAAEVQLQGENNTGEELQCLSLHLGPLILGSTPIDWTDRVRVQGSRFSLFLVAEERLDSLLACRFPKSHKQGMLHTGCMEKAPHLPNTETRVQRD